MKNWLREFLMLEVQCWTVALAVLVFGFWIAPPSMHGYPAILGEWIRHDAWEYVKIARVGYAARYLSVWAPLYPLLIRLLSWLPGGAVVGSLLLANAAAAVSFLGLSELSSGSPRPLRYLRAYPLAFFLVAPWAMSLLLAFSLWCFVFSTRRRFFPATLCCVFACLTGWLGVLCAIPLCYHWLKALFEGHQAKPQILHQLVEPFVCLFAAPFGIGLYLLYQVMHYHGSVVSFSSERMYFGHQFTWPWLSLWLIATQLLSVWRTHPTDLPRLLVDVIPTVSVFALAVYASVKRLWPLDHALYTFGLLASIVLLPSLGQHFPDIWVSAGRYLVLAIPVYLLLPCLRSRSRFLLDHPELEAYSLVALETIGLVLLAFYLLGGWLV